MLATLKEAAETLLDKLDQVEADTHYLFVLASQHCMSYHGANYSEEKNQLRRLLKQIDEIETATDPNA